MKTLSEACFVIVSMRVWICCTNAVTTNDVNTECDVRIAGSYTSVEYTQTII